MVAAYEWLLQAGEQEAGAVVVGVVEGEVGVEVTLGLGQAGGLTGLLALKGRLEAHKVAADMAFYRGTASIV